MSTKNARAFRFVGVEGMLFHKMCMCIFLNIFMTCVGNFIVFVVLIFFLLIRDFGL